MKDHSYRDVAKIPVQEYDSTIINGNGVPWMQTKAHVWMCGASDNGDLTRKECTQERPVIDEAYIPEPFPEHLFEPFGRTQILSTLDICVNKLTPTKFCDEEGYDLVTLQMASVILESGSESDENEEKLTRKLECKRIVDEISIIDIEKQTEDEFRDSLSKDLPLLDEYFPMIEADDERSSESENERKKVPQLEKFYDFSNQKPRRQECYRQKRSRKSMGKQDKPMPLVKNKTAYLRFVKANDCVKDKITEQFAKTQKWKNQKKNKHERKGIKLNEGWEIRSKMTKIKRKSEYNKLKKTLKDVWTTEMETDKDVNSDKMDVPFHYKKYTIQDRKIIVQQPMRELKEPGTSYDGPKKAKKIDLVEPGEEPKPAYIATDLTEEEEQLLIATLKQYKDVFAWSSSFRGDLGAGGRSVATSLWRDNVGGSEHPPPPILSLEDCIERSPDGVFGESPSRSFDSSLEEVRSSLAKSPILNLGSRNAISATPNGDLGISNLYGSPPFQSFNQHKSSSSPNWWSPLNKGQSSSGVGINQSEKGGSPVSGVVQQNTQSTENGDDGDDWVTNFWVWSK
ncbi:hypothetical protein L7F22_023840 [Adiantum nelumboides]|nr:hypothetical protein [Adiantum nelumboides]